MMIHSKRFIMTMMLLLIAGTYLSIGLSVAQTATPTWVPRSSCPPNATIEAPSMNLYNKSIGDLFGYGDLSLTSVNNFIGDVIMPFLLVYGIFFWAGLFGVIAVTMFITQENVWVPISLTLVGGGPIVLWQLPYDWQKAVGTIVILGIAALLYAARKKRYS
jgi:hypothetical protein